MLNCNKLKAALVEAQITQENLSKKLGKSRVHISNMVNGKAKVTAEDLFLISQLTNKDMNIFFEK